MSHMQQFVIFYDYIFKARCKQEFLQAHSDGSIKRLKDLKPNPKQCQHLSGNGTPSKKKTDWTPLFSFFFFFYNKKNISRLSIL